MWIDVDDLTYLEGLFDQAREQSEATVVDVVGHEKFRVVVDAPDFSANFLKSELNVKIENSLVSVGQHFFEVSHE